MADEARWLNLDDIVREVTETPTQGPADLAVWGGTSDASRLGDFLQTWDLPRPGMPWNVWQWTDQIRLGHGEGSPGDLDYLERGRVFGEEGDLSLRRDGSRFLWHFVGVTGTAPPDGFKFDDYWDDRAGAPLRSRQRTALLWGEERRDESGNPLGIWQEDRVAAAVLEYPGLRGARRVRMRYREYLRGGRVELVWLLDLEEVAE
jgi:hypothetical protein